ncbi:MAG TPA: sodium-dependent transporter [Syntrophales bacterium]|nr:sodium-dependent transporter [Syntrophales bacterium]HOL58704.1 sodium-dependent transporter [Syntrophales bacterium]HPO35008.1 sodium-dependent transporter [Syntrophales bacterium]
MREQWGSKFGFVMAAAGSAVGLGNIWKFPYLTGSKGGAAFVVVYLLAVFILGLPLMIAELVIGRHTEKDPVGAFKTMVGGTPWVLVGYLGVLSGFLILSYYSVVGGWTIGYIVKGVTGALSNLSTPDAAAREFREFTVNPVLSVLFHLLFMAACMYIVIGGVRGGIEKWNKVLMPLLFVILLVLIVRGFLAGGGEKGLTFYLTPDFSKITGETIMAALGQAFFSLSLGMGAMITYGSYLSPRERILSAAFWIVFLDTAVALLAGFAIFPSVFAMELSPAEGPGLVFHVIPAVFARMPAGQIFAVLFFILLFLAAVTSGVSLLEVVCAYLIDERGWSRRRAVLIMGSSIALLGIPSALSFGCLSHISILGGTFFDFIDKLTSNYMLPIGGFFIAICLGWKYGLEKTIHELDPDTPFLSVKELWAFTIKFISPFVLLLVFVALVREDVVALFKRLFT